jgi:ABC-type nitrate/sulfonate/bicarbonate transport system ATPase subunit
LNNGFGNDFEKYARTLLQNAAEKRVAAIGITDYFSVEGYKQLRQLLDEPAALRDIVGEKTAAYAQDLLIIPNIELRAAIIVNDSRVNFHVMFSEDVPVGTIEDSFLRELKFTAESNPESPDERWSLTIEHLRDLGSRLKSQHANFQNRSDLHIGMMNAVVDPKDVKDVLTRHESRFKGRYLFVLPADEDLSNCSWDGQGHQSRKLLIQKSHMLFSSNPATREFGLGKKHDSEHAFKAEFKTLKPCIHSSDSHDFSTLFEPHGHRYTWIKANPTFEGLRQLLHEPESRVFIGERPPSFSHIEENATKYIDVLEFEGTDRAIKGENWFAGQIPLNSGLVAIIGNKGAAKSALVDILALLGNTHRAQEFSFLTKERFLSPKDNFGTMFQATLTWRSKASATRLLDSGVDLTIPEKVKYIPQSYLEKICSELGDSNDEFDSELKGVIYSHVGKADRLGKATLFELITYLTQETEDKIQRLASKLAIVNRDIVALEAKLTTEYRTNLEARRQQRLAELKAHDEAKPAEVKPPTKDPAAKKETAELNKKLEELKDQETTLEQEIAQTRMEEQQAAAELAAADRLSERIQNLRDQVEAFYADSIDEAHILGLDLKDLLSIQVKNERIVAKKAKAEKAREVALNALAEIPGSLPVRLAEIGKTLEELRQQLDEPNQRYQKYLRHLKDWQRKRDSIEGSAEFHESLKGLDADVAALDTLPSRLDAKTAERETLVREIFASKEVLRDKYTRLHAPVQEFIDGHPISKQNGGLEFHAAISEGGFEKTFLSYIHQGRRGSFQGEREGRERVRDLISSADFSTVDGAVGFVETVLETLLVDNRNGSAEDMRVGDQLRQPIGPEAVYDYVFGLDFLQPKFELRWQGKSLDQLSPGERGSLLLVFYLLIDKRDTPLLIDQPEENLDNQTIAKMLVPSIKEAKERRQIIMVTHNPNLAVVCDADQVIHARLDKADGNRVTYQSGAIEDPTITQLIVDILEGTKPAFDLRDAKYGVLETSSGTPYQSSPQKQ